MVGWPAWLSTTQLSLAWAGVWLWFSAPALNSWLSIVGSHENCTAGLCLCFLSACWCQWEFWALVHSSSHRRRHSIKASTSQVDGDWANSLLKLPALLQSCVPIHMLLVELQLVLRKWWLSQRQTLPLQAKNILITFFSKFKVSKA